MKFKIKTLDHRDFSVELSDLKTVWELKQRVCRLRGVWLHPEKQRLLYAGHVLDDRMQLRSYCIDERKFLLMLPKRESPRQPKSSSTTSISTIFQATDDSGVQPMYIPTGVIKEHIMQLGPWNESEVRRALLISLNNPNRAVDYLTFGKAPFQRMISPPSSNLFLTASNQHLRNAVSIPQSPELQAHHDSEYHIEDFDENEKLPIKEKVVRWNLPKSSSRLNSSSSEIKISDSMRNIKHLVNIGFPQDIVMDAFLTCDRNIEQAAILLFEQYMEESKDSENSKSVK